jgi:NifU-like protein involved in Fe-S cluster formation
MCITLPYGLKVLELSKDPKNIGSLENIEGASGRVCGDLIKLYLKMKSDSEEDVIEKATLESYGCVANIALTLQLRGGG